MCICHYQSHKATGSKGMKEARKLLLVLLAAFYKFLRGPMTKQLKAIMSVVLLVNSVLLPAQTSSTATPKTTKKAVAKKAPVESETDRQIRELRQQMQNQQSQIDGLKQQLADRDARLSNAAQSAQAANAAAAAATAQTQSMSSSIQANSDAVTALNSTVSDLKVSTTGIAQTISETKKDIGDRLDSPTALRYKGVNITPVAFFAFEGVWRQRSVNSDVNTPFNSIPFMGANEAHTTELNFSGRQSRVGGLFTGDVGQFKLAGYVEADFLGAGTTSNDNQSNSFVLRQRQIWGQAATKSGFTVTGGQMWSLVTETGKSTDNRTEKLPNTIDAQYMVGFSWARQPSIRLQQKFTSGSDALTFAVSAEQGQITNYNATNGPTNFFFNGPGQNGGLFNAFNGTPTNNLAPDVVVKIATDTVHSHLELGGLARFLRDRYYPAVASPATGIAASPGAAPINDTKFAGGVFGSGRVSPNKYLDLAFQAMAGDGVGRYGSAQLPDVTVHPKGTLEPIRNYHGLASVETHPTPKLDVYGYFGGEYDQRTVYATGVAASPFTGYGSINTVATGCNTEVPVTTAATGGSITPAANCSAVTRAIFEGMAGWTYRIYNSPKYGRLQYQVNYQYITRSAWTALTGGTYGAANATFGSPKAVDNMVFTSMRYYIP